MSGIAASPTAPRNDVRVKACVELQHRLLALTRKLILSSRLIVGRKTGVPVVFQALLPYIKIFGMLIGSAFGLPIPEDFALIVAGFWISSGDADAVAMALVCYTGVLAGDLVIFRAGRMAGPAIFRRRWVRSRLKSKRLRRLRKGLSERAFLTVLVARHVFYLRTVTFLLCGAVRMSFTRFIVADAVAALITVPLVVGLGYLFGDYQDDLLTMVHRAKYTIGTLAFLVGSYFVWRYVRKKRKSRKKAIAHNYG